MMHENNPALEGLLAAKRAEVNCFRKYLVTLNGEQVDTVYANTALKALDKASKTHGLECDVERAHGHD